MGNLIVDLMVENGNLDKEVKRLQGVLKGLEEQNKEVAKENKELKASVDYLKSLSNDKIYAVLNDDMLELKNKNEKQAKLLGTLKGKLVAQRRNSRKLQRDLEQEEIESKNLMEQNEQLIRSYNRMKNELDRVNRKRAEELNENSVLSNVIKTYESSDNSLINEIKNLKEELVKLKSKEYINEKWGRYENTINDLKRTLNEYEVREKDYIRDIEQLNKKRDDDLRTINKLYKDRQTLFTMNSNKNIEINSLKDMIKKYENEKERLQSKNKDLKEIIDKKNKTIVHFMNKNKESEEACTGLNREVIILFHTLDEKQALIDKLNLCSNNGELSRKVYELIERYLNSFIAPASYIPLEKEINFGEHLLSSILFIHQLKLISEPEYERYVIKITDKLNELREGNDNEKR